jgi:RNA-dependent RNA polymerase
MDFEALIQGRGVGLDEGSSESDEVTGMANESLERKASNSISAEHAKGTERVDEVLQSLEDSPSERNAWAKASATEAPPHRRSQSATSLSAQNAAMRSSSFPRASPDASPHALGQTTLQGPLVQMPAPTSERYIPLRRRLNGYSSPYGTHNNASSRNDFRRPQRTRAPRNTLELKLDVCEIPLSWTTWDVHQLLMPYGNVAYISLRGPATLYQNAFVCFRPAPADVSWVGTNIACNGLKGEKYFFKTIDRSADPFVYKISNVRRSPPEEHQQSYLEKIRMPVDGVRMGVMRGDDEMLVLHSVEATGAEMMLNLREKALQLDFAIRAPPTGGDGASEERYRHFKLTIDLALLHEIRVRPGSDERTSLVFTADEPPLLYRKTTNIRATHDLKRNEWQEEHSWFRQTDVDISPMRRNGAIQLQKRDAIVETGRWTTFQIVYDEAKSTEAFIRGLYQAFQDHNISLDPHRDVKFTVAEPNSLWEWQQDLSSTDDTSAADSSLFDMQQMTDDSVHLAFSVHYQLEVCLSLGVLNESNIDHAFLVRLSTIDTVRAVKILEKVATEGKRVYKPHDIFSLHNRVSVVEKKKPSYCSKIPAANITPTTVYFSTPVLETSNRVVRKYPEHEDRFMRVKFTDEKHKGKLQAQDGNGMNEVFSRIKQAMTYGIRVAGRHYEFLAFGNAQFREHGAWFFASTPKDNADTIREWMGNFTQIRNIAKYISRLGQCFTTTKAVPYKFDLVPIPDVERNGYCFTDGVGKISVLLANLVAGHFRLADCPSVFQFRMAGCKGVLVIDPSLKDLAIAIRPSQEKFPAEYYGLEICKYSQFSAANLNMQLILVLSSLGVADDVFVRKYREMLADLAKAMTNEEMALKLLQKNIDYNQMTISLATMILDGFMARKDPFMISCLRLWRSWNLKYLKEKARVFVDQGAFLFGVTDETGTLQGHFESDEVERGDAHVPPALPQIFLQIPSPDNKGGYTVIQGTCLFARNPSLHPGDIRMVEAVDVPALHHLKDCVVLPQTGDRDLANMCSGGDLDGDDYLISWDVDLFPPTSEWNYPPMDYTSPPPVLSSGPVTVDDMTSFFVNYIKNDKLGRIATNHRMWADREDDGVMNEKCLQLANLHSIAVDYNKTGVPSNLPAELKIKERPHWAEPRRRSYKSRKVLGKLYDEVKLDNFLPAWNLPFDARISTAAEPSTELLAAATEVKAEYDESMRRIMKQYGIKNEFEVFTTFVQQHHNDLNDYKFYEKIGEVRNNLVDQFKEICYVKAGTDISHREWTKLKPFLVAMYTVTANQVSDVVALSKETIVRGGRLVPNTVLTFETVPLMSFPWIFANELGRIANGRDDPKFHHATAMPRPTLPKKKGGQADKGKKMLADLIGEGAVLPDLPEIRVEERVIGRGEVLDLYHGDTGRDGPTIGEIGAGLSSTGYQDGDRVAHLQDGTTANAAGTTSSLPDVPSTTIPADHTSISQPESAPQDAFLPKPSSRPSTPTGPAETPPSEPLSALPASSAQSPIIVETHAADAEDENAADKEDEEGEEVVLTLEDNPSRKWMMDDEGGTDSE